LFVQPKNRIFYIYKTHFFPVYSKRVTTTIQ